MNDDLLKLRCKQLEEVNAKLREQIQQLSNVLLPPELDMTLEFGLTSYESKLLTVLILNSEKVVTKEYLLDVMYATRISDKDIPDLKIIDVFVCKVRKKLALFYDIEIITHWGKGYELPRKSFLTFLDIKSMTEHEFNEKYRKVKL